MKYLLWSGNLLSIAVSRGGGGGWGGGGEGGSRVSSLIANDEVLFPSYEMSSGLKKV